MSKIRSILPKEVPEDQVILGLARGENYAVQHVYKTYFPAIARMIINNNGSEQDAKDIFQEAVVVLYNKITQRNFELSSKLSTFLYAVSRRLWLKQLAHKGSKSNTSDISDFEDILQIEESLIDHEEIEQRFEKMNHALIQLGEPCQTLLKDFYIENLSMENIKEKFGYTNADNAKTQKYKCLQRLKKLFFKY